MAGQNNWPTHSSIAVAVHGTVDAAACEFVAAQYPTISYPPLPPHYPLSFCYKDFENAEG